MYRRFLNNDDYLGIITPEALAQLTRGNDARFIQAEESAEMSIVEYLSENYEIEKELDLRPLYWKKAIEVYYAVVIAVAVVAGIVMPNV